ncbi:spermidine/putrescine transport system permease protein [Anaerotaenia torta]
MAVIDKLKHLTEKSPIPALRFSHADKTEAGGRHPVSSSMKWLSFPYIIWMVGFIIIPLIMIIYYGLTSSKGFTLDNVALIADPVNRRALVLALELSVVSTILCLLLAYPLAMILNNSKLESNSFIVLIIILPMWMNFLLRTIAWQNILEKTGVLNKMLEFLHLPLLNIINTPSAIILGMVYNFLPFMVLPIYNVLIKIDRDVVNAARDLGASSSQTFLRIILPLSLPGVISGITMVFVPSLTTFVISTILGGSKIVLIGNVIEQQFRLGNWNTGSGLSLVLMIFILFCMAVLSKYDKEKEGSNLW